MTTGIIHTHGITIPGTMIPGIMIPGTDHITVHTTTILIHTHITTPDIIIRHPDPVEAELQISGLTVA